jgi:hypothetical protein
MTASTTTMTEGYEMAKRIENEPMTLELLHLAIDNINPDGFEGIPFSDGMRWIARHTQAFLELLEAESIGVEEFFQQHLHNHEVDGLLWNSWLLLALGDERRVDFVCEVFLAGGAVNQDWLTAALSAGLTKEQLAEMVLDKLRQDRIHPVYNYVNFTKHEFVGRGSGRIERLWNGSLRFDEYRPTYWSMLSDGQLFEASRIVISKCPGVFFASSQSYHDACLAEKLALRLSDEQVNQLLIEAADAIETLDSVNPKVLKLLPLDVQLKTARRLAQQDQVVPLWVANMALTIGSENGGLELLSEFEEGFGSDIAAYQQWYQRCESFIKGQEPGDLKVVERVTDLFRQAFKKDGWIFGTLREEVHQSRHQLYVQAGRRKYVQDRHQTTYGQSGGMRTFARVGDVVLFRAESGRMLVPGRVWAVSFTLLHRPL